MVIDNKKDERLTNFRLLVSWKAYKDLNLEDRLWYVQKMPCEIIKYALQNEITVYFRWRMGVDALLKSRIQEYHNDIDLFVELKHYHDYIYVIKQHGFEEVNTDYTHDGHTVWKDDKQRIMAFTLV